MKRYIVNFIWLAVLLSMFSLGAQGSQARAGMENRWTTLEGIKHPTGGYAAQKRLERVPLTIEAWVYLPKSMYDMAAGTILSTYATQKKDSFTFSIQVSGVPKLSIAHRLGQREYTFSNAAIPPETWTHIAMVCTEENLLCYLNGQLAAYTMPEIWYPMPEAVVLDALCLGGDRRELNKNGFRGILGDVTLYADIRTPTELQWDATQEPDLYDHNLLLHYDMDTARFGQTIPDASANGYDMTYQRQWLTEEELAQLRAQDDRIYTHTLAFLPDIQHTTELYPQRLKPVFDYLLENREQKNIQYLISVGDLTNDNTQAQWTPVVTQTKRLDGILPYSLIRGNHDGFGKNKQTYFDQYYGSPGSAYYQHIRENGGFFREDSVANTYLCFTMGQVDYLLLNLDFGAEDAVLQWAAQVLQQHADRRAIVVTHGYLHTDGKPITGDQAYAPCGYRSELNDGDDLWNKLLRKHENIALVVSGHITHDHIVHAVTTGDAGNTVHQLLLDTQYTDRLLSGAGFLSLMEFTEDGRYARIMHYSTVHDLYFQESASQLVLDFGSWKEEPQDMQEELAQLLEFVTTPEGESILLLISVVLFAGGLTILLLHLGKKKMADRH